MTLGALLNEFVEDPEASEKNYLGRKLAVELTSPRAGQSMYSTPVFEGSDRSHGELLAVLVLPYGSKAKASFRTLEGIAPEGRLVLTGECRMVANENVLVFKNCSIAKS